MEYPNFKVTVRCMTYNQSRYITDAMNGFTMQQTSFPFVCTIVDDASIDGEQEVIRKYVEENFDFSEGSVAYQKETDYAHITYAQHKTNKNCYFAVLYLKENHYSQRKDKRPYLKEWRGMCEYEALCEGDDYWIAADKLEKQVTYLDANPVCMLCGTNGLILWDDGYSYPSYFNRIFKSRNLLPSEVIGGWLLPTASLVYRLDIRKDYPEWTRKIYSGDQTLILIALSKGTVYCISNLTTVYRKNKNPYSISNSLKKHKRSYMFEQHKVLYNYYKDYTGDKFIKEIDSHVKRLDKTITYYNLLDNSALLAFLRMPLFFVVMHIKSFKHPLLQYLYNGNKCYE